MRFIFVLRANFYSFGNLGTISDCRSVTPRHPDTNNTRNDGRGLETHLRLPLEPQVFFSFFFFLTSVLTNIFIIRIP
jgi:hypothetical protein